MGRETLGARLKMDDVRIVEWVREEVNVTVEKGQTEQRPGHAEQSAKDNKDATNGLVG